MQNALGILSKPLWFFVYLYLLKYSEGCECGRSPSNRIYKGHKVSSSEFPWMAELQSNHDNVWVLCGATVISSRYAVSAGHCKPESKFKNHYLRTGDAKFPNEEEQPNVESIIVKDGSDIALIKTNKDLNVPPICLPSQDQTFTGAKATILGYGKTETGHGSDDLLAGDVTIPSNEKCNDLQPPIRSTQICGGNYGGEPSICFGDSGGPLMYHDDADSRWYLIGVAAATLGCDNKNYYGIFTRVSSFVPWIQENSKNAGCQANI